MIDLATPPEDTAVQDSPPSSRYGSTVSAVMRSLDTREEPTVQLLRRAIAGDRDACGDLCELSRAYVSAIVKVHVNDVHGAEDCVQEIFLRITRSLATYKIHDESIALHQFNGWIKQIAINVTKNYHRVHQNKLWQHSDVDDRRISDRVTLRQDRRTLGPDQIAILEEEAALIKTAIAALSERHRRILMAFHFEYWSYHDIAEDEQTSSSAVKSAIKRAREALSVKLYEMGFDYALL